MQAIQDANRRGWDRLVVRKHSFTQPASDDQLSDPLRAIDSLGWLGGSVSGKRVLCLGAGGGKYSVLFAAAGAEVTVVDLSPAMLALDRHVAAERGLAVRTIEASMDDLSVLPQASFDIVAQPVSTCYVPDILAVYRAVARVTVAGGLYVSQHKQPVSLQAEPQASGGGYAIVESYYRSGPLPASAAGRLREAGTLEFLHRWEEIVGGLCRSGFVVEDLVEPCHASEHAEPGSFAHRSQYIAPYVRIKARRVDRGCAARIDDRSILIEHR
jgi:SAM-dependent methyltransferase